MSGLISIHTNKIPFNPETDAITNVLAPSIGTGIESEHIKTSLEVLKRRTSILYTEVKRFDQPIEEKLFDTLASLKILTSQVAMHLDRDQRDKIFKQLDNLLDPDEWDNQDKLLDQSSYSTFLRMILYQPPIKRPSLGLSNTGNLLAAWIEGTNRLSIECFPHDEIRWVLSRMIDGEPESAAGRTPLYRLPTVLAPYNADQWFLNDHRVFPAPR